MTVSTKFDEGSKLIAEFSMRLRICTYGVAVKVTLKEGRDCDSLFVAEVSLTQLWEDARKFFKVPLKCLS